MQPHLLGMRSYYGVDQNESCSGCEVSMAGWTEKHGNPREVVKTTRVAVRVCTWLVSSAAILFALSMLCFLRAVMRPRDLPCPILDSHVSADAYQAVYTEVFSTHADLDAGVPVGVENEDGKGSHRTTKPYALHQLVCRPAQTPTGGVGADNLVFFVPGNAGSYKQVSRLGCTVLHVCSNVDGVYSFDFAEQANIHRGMLLRQHAAFIVQAVKSVRRSRENMQQGKGRHGGGPIVWLIGHSMGGVVARLAAVMMMSSGTSTLVDHLITLNTPHRQPPIFLDTPMLDVYTSFWRRPANGSQSAAHQQCEPSHIVSITSGALDLQVEPELTRPGRTMYDTAVCRIIRTEDPGVCGKMMSHNDIVYDHCVANFISLLIANGSTRNPQLRGEKEEQQQQKRECQPSGGGGDNAVSPHTNSVTTFFSLWAWLSVTSHAFPFALASLYMALVVAAIRPFFFHLHGVGSWKLILHIRHHFRLPQLCPCHWCCSSSSSYFAVQWVALLKAPVLGVVLITIFVCLSSRLLLQLRCCVFPEDDWCNLPWVSDSLVWNPGLGWSVLPFSLVGVLGPVLVGSWLGVAAYHLLRLLLHTSARGWVMLSRLHGVLCFSSRRQILKRGHKIPAVVYAAAVVFFGWLLSFGLCSRAMVWFTLSLLLLPLRALQQNDMLTVYPPVAADCHAQVVVYSLLHALHLHPFFVLQNKWNSNTEDDITLIDGYSRTVEVLLHVLLLNQLLLPLCHSIKGKLPLKGSESPLECISCSASSMLLAGAGAGACLPLAFSLMAMCSVPVESFRVVWVLLCAFPVVLLGCVISARGRSISGGGSSSSSSSSVYCHHGSCVLKHTTDVCDTCLNFEER